MSSISAVASNSSGVGIAAGSNDQLLSRSPIKSSFVSSSSSHLRVTPPHSKENGVVDCISRAELEKSYTNGLTKSSKTPPDSQGKQRGRGALDLCSRGYRLFQAYLKHVAMVLVTFSVVILACSLRGKQVKSAGYNYLLLLGHVKFTKWLETDQVMYKFVLVQHFLSALFACQFSTSTAIQS